MSAATALEVVEQSDRPEWCPEGVWQPLKREIVLMHAKVNRSSLGQVAAKYGVELGKLRGHLNKRVVRISLEEAREDLAQASIVAAYRTGEMLQEALSDPEKAAKLSARDLSIINKQQSENALNLANGQVGSPAFGSINFNDVKVLLGASLEKPKLDV